MYAFRTLQEQILGRPFVIVHARSVRPPRSAISSATPARRFHAPLPCHLVYARENKAARRWEVECLQEAEDVRNSEAYAPSNDALDEGIGCGVPDFHVDAVTIPETRS